MLGADDEAQRYRWSKVWRYVGLYGIGRTLFKVAGRSRRNRFISQLFLRSASIRDISIVGCGQFAFATIGYVIGLRFGRRFAHCYDPARQAAASFARFYGASHSASAAATITAPDVRFVYIASNHATHAAYATDALAAGKVVYVEKPVAVNEEQLRLLCAAVRAATGRIYAGYNRPFSQAITRLSEYCKGAVGPLTLACFISGHKLEPQHWYRHPDEGTRICGNVGHWLDLAVHVLSWRGLPDQWRITLTWSDVSSRDDDLAISLVSERGDLVSIVLTARSEPFEGINETINLHWHDVIAKIDDFRRMEVWRGARRHLHRFRRKDVGHQAAILQPFTTAQCRAWHEVELSSLLTLRIARMVRAEERSVDFSFGAEWARLGVAS